MITDETRKLIWDEVIKRENFRSPILPHERTKSQLMREYNLSRAIVERILQSLLEEGRVQKREAITSDGKHCTAYSFVNPDEEFSFNS